MFEMRGMDDYNHIRIPVLLKSVVMPMCWLLILLINLPHAHCQPHAYNYCNEQSYKCGTLSNVSYPFWGQNRPRQCGGGDSFKLTCQDDASASILIGLQNFTVKRINLTTQTMRLVPRDLALSVCSPQSEDANVNSHLFRYSPSVYNITIFYDCPRVADFSSGYNFTCGNALSYFGVENETQFNEFPPLQSCKRRLRVPTDASLDYVAGGGDLALQKVLNEGFEIKYNVSQNCTRCLGSEGNCSSDVDKLSCYYCPDGSQSHALNCSAHDLKGDFFDELIGLSIILGAAVAGGFMTCIIYCCCKCMRLKVKIWLRRKKGPHIEAFLENHEALRQKRYKFSEVKKMTNSFKVKLGEGGYGAVYKGEILNGYPVAVKILNGSKGNGEDFINEVASISRTSHVNVVTLLGFCLEDNKKALIYEFMHNGSLDKFINNKGLEATPSLSWDNLWQIASGIARGLEYLHKGCNTQILHFDIKPHNILLDENFCPKISDFGLAKLCPRNESNISMSDARGTIGYVAPEVWNRNFGGISHRSDVYSYGMMLLEMMGVRKNINVEASHTSEMYFPDWIYKRLEQGEDLRTDGVVATEEEEISRRMTVVGLWCVQTFPKDRPTMSGVINMLEGNINSLEMPPKPVFSSPTRSVPESTTSSF